jgi:hypothetical protein
MNALFFVSDLNSTFIAQFPQGTQTKKGDINATLFAY